MQGGASPTHSILRACLSFRPSLAVPSHAAPTGIPSFPPSMQPQRFLLFPRPTRLGVPPRSPLASPLRSPALPFVPLVFPSVPRVSRVLFSRRPFYVSVLCFWRARPGAPSLCLSPCAPSRSRLPPCPPTPLSRHVTRPLNPPRHHHRALPPLPRITLPKLHHIHKHHTHPQAHLLPCHLTRHMVAEGCRSHPPTRSPLLLPLTQPPSRRHHSPPSPRTTLTSTHIFHLCSPTSHSHRPTTFTRLLSTRPPPPSRSSTLPTPPRPACITLRQLSHLFFLLTPLHPISSLPTSTSLPNNSYPSQPHPNFPISFKTTATNHRSTTSSTTNLSEPPTRPLTPTHFHYDTTSANTQPQPPFLNTFQPVSPSLNSPQPDPPPLPPPRPSPPRAVRCARVGRGNGD